MAMCPAAAGQHRRQHGSDAVDHAIDIERHGAAEAVEVDRADIERRVHACAEQSEIDRPERTLDLAAATFRRA